MADPAPLTVHCRLTLLSWDMVFVSSPGLRAVFTLGEVLIIFGNCAVLDACLRRQATVETARPIAWPLHLKRPPTDLVQLLPPPPAPFVSDAVAGLAE